MNIWNTNVFLVYDNNTFRIFVEIDMLGMMCVNYICWSVESVRVLLKPSRNMLCPIEAGTRKSKVADIAELASPYGRLSMQLPEKEIHDVINLTDLYEQLEF